MYAISAYGGHFFYVTSTSKFTSNYAYLEVNFLGPQKFTLRYQYFAEKRSRNVNLRKIRNNVKTIFFDIRLL